MRGWLILATALAPVVVSADATIVEKLSVTAGGKTIEGMRTTYISGERMRIETVLPEQSATTVYDLPAGSMIGLDMKAKRAEIRIIAARAAAVEKDYPRARAEAGFTATGASREIAGVACSEQAFTIRVPMVSDGSIALKLTGTACLAARADGVISVVLVHLALAAEARTGVVLPLGEVLSDHAVPAHQAEHQGGDAKAPHADL